MLQIICAEATFGTITVWMGATRFRMRRLRHVANGMALIVLARNGRRILPMIGVPAR